VHYLCLVVGENVDELLAPFAEYVETQPYKEFVEPDELEQMAKHFGITSIDIDALAAKLPEWHRADGGVEDGRLFYWSTANPHTRFDWYEIGGRFSGYLHLRRAAPPSWWDRLRGRRGTDRVNRALKGDVNTDLVLANPPAALLHEGQWHECPITQDKAQLATWKGQFGALFRSIPDDALLTAVDLHL
jgi:hypothetical protein